MIVYENPVTNIANLLEILQILQKMLEKVNASLWSQG